MKKFNLKEFNLSHAILLCKDGDLSDITSDIAKSFVCLDENSPCNLCKYCKKVDDFINPDVIILDFLDKNISVDEIRKLKKDCYILPNECKNKVYIIKNGHNLGIPAQNALLKTLEEPPSHAKFIIECKTDKFFLDTILSRCLVLRFNTLSNIVDDEILQLATKITQGIIKNDELSIIEVKIKTKEQLLLVLYQLKIFLRDSLMLESLTTANLTIVERLKSSKTTAELFEIYELCTKIEQLCEYNVIVQNMIYYFATNLNKGE